MKISNDADYEDWLDIVPQLYGVLTQGDLTEQKQGKDEQLANEPATDSQAPESDNQAPKKKKGTAAGAAKHAVRVRPAKHFGYQIGTYSLGRTGRCCQKRDLIKWPRLPLADRLTPESQE